MNKEELREAVNQLDNLKMGDVIYSHDKVAIERLVNLAQSYLSIDGLPEEDESEHDDENSICLCAAFEDYNLCEIRKETHNDCLHLCRLAMLKKCEGLDKVIGEAIREWKVVGEIDYYGHIASAIKSHFLEGK